MGSARAALIAALLAAVPACIDDRCDGALLDAIYLHVVDGESGEPVEARVTATLDGDGVRVTCTSRRTSAEPCLTWAVGPMLDGSFEVRVEAERRMPVVQTIDVPAGECGPLSVERTIELGPAIAVM